MKKNGNVLESLDLSHAGSCEISLSPASQTPSSSPGRVKEGDRIGGMFDVMKILGGEGKSGMGIVYICYHARSKSVVALKTFQDRYIVSPRIKDRFTREAMAWTCLGSHPFIVRALTSLEFDSRLYVVLEFVSPNERNRNTLTHYLEDELSLKQVLVWAIQFCHGMEYAASQGVTPHRDIKPDNIMITRDGDVKITDFGLARLWDQVGEAAGIDRESKPTVSEFSFFHTVKGRSIVGTLPWMAPEQFEGISDNRSDIYSFGVVLYQMLHRGELPFNGRTVEEFCNAHKKQPVPKQNSELFPVIDKCLRKDPGKRFATFAELRAVLIRIYRMLTGSPPPTFPEAVDLSAYDHIGMGNAFHYLGMYDRAIEEYRRAILIKGDIAAVHKNLGLVLYEKGAYDEALREYREALKLHPMWAEVYYHRGNALKQKGSFERAIGEYQEALRLNSEWAEARYQLGTAYQENGQIDEAIREFRRSLHYKPKDARALRNLGIALQENYFDLKCKLQKMVSVDISTAALSRRALSTRIMTLELQSEDAYAAIPTLEEEPINEEFIEMLEYELFLGMAGMEKYGVILDESLQCLTAALELDPDDGMSHCYFGIACSEKGLFEEAVRELTAALTEQPGMERLIRSELATTYFRLGIYLKDNGALNEAIEALRKAIQYRQNFPEAHYRLGTILQEQGRLPDAAGEFRCVLYNRPDDYRVHTALGNVLYARGLFDKAVRAFREALKLKIDYEPAVNNLGLTFKAKGELDQASKYLRKALRLNPDYPACYINLGLVYEDMGRFKAAIKEFKKALKINPEYTIAHFNIGNACFKKGDFEGADKYYRTFLQRAAPGLTGYIEKVKERLEEIKTCHER